MPQHTRASTIKAGGADAAVEVLVFSRGCSGAEVESLLGRSRRAPCVPTHRDPVSEVSCDIKFAIVEDAFEYNVQGDRVPLPVPITRNRRQRVGLFVAWLVFDAFLAQLSYEAADLAEWSCVPFLQIEMD
jgi:hypothetical protein